MSDNQKLVCDNCNADAEEKDEVCWNCSSKVFQYIDKPTSPQGMNSQEELKKADEFAVNEHMRSLGFKWDDTRETWYNADNVWMYQKAAINLSTRIEAEASRRERAAQERVLDELDMLGRDEHELRDWIEAKRQSLKEKETI